MLWLIALVFLLQASFYWFLKPLLLFSTPFLEVRGAWIIALILGAWLIAGRSISKDPD